MSARIRSIDTAAEHALSIAPKLDYLKELSGGDQSFIAEILELFITDAPQAVEHAFGHLQQRNFEMLRITVHKLKSSVQVVGGYHLTHLIHEIESNAKENGKQDALFQMLSLLRNGIQHLVNHLCQELKSLSSAGNAA
ncbi:MAG TPA: Hpt domain-containing protein [Chitinophagales bacterium]|nr:Hpt domain-containing protein [Chitinophagales bacterium]